MSRNRVGQSRMHGMPRTLGLIALLAALALSLPLVAGFLSRVHPAFDTLAHLRVHLAVLLLLVALVLIAIPGFRLNGLVAAALGAGAILTVNGLSVIPGMRPVQAAHDAGEGPTYRLMHLNLRFNNPEPGKVLSLIGRLRPDVVTLAEVSPMWAEKLALIESAYPYRLLCSLDGYAGGVAILSVRPFAEGSQNQCMEGGVFAKAAVDFGGRTVEVGALHLHRPWPYGQWEQLQDALPMLGTLGGTAILAGDLNATPWSAASAEVGEAAGMTPAGPYSPTWQWRRLPEWLRFAGVPIDRVFTKGDVAVRSVETGEWVGSDHLPVLMEFTLASPPAPDSEEQNTTARI